MGIFSLKCFYIIFCALMFLLEITSNNIFLPLLWHIEGGLGLVGEFHTGSLPHRLLSLMVLKAASVSELGHI